MSTSKMRELLRARVSRGHPPCGICGLAIDYSLPYPMPWSFVVDHKTPVTKGGTDDATNLQAAHQRCNLAKSDRPWAPDIVRRSGSLRRGPQGG